MRTKEELENAVKESKNYSDVCRYFGIIPKGANFSTIKEEISKYNIDISHFKTTSWNKGLRYISAGVKTLDEIMVENSVYNSHKLKKRLFNANMKEEKCECCGLSEWQNQKIPLELHHINGNHNDNRLENLQILCPNCHALTQGYRGSNQKRYKITEKNAIILNEEEYVNHRKEQKKIKKESVLKLTKYVCPICGKEFTPKNKTQKYCSVECSNKQSSKKPLLNELLQDIEIFGMNQSKIAIKYNVSPNTIKKWFKSYGLYEKDVYINQVKRKINQYDENGNLIKTWNSVTEALVKYPSLRNSLSGKKKSGNGFIWRYVE